VVEGLVVEPIAGSGGICLRLGEESALIEADQVVHLVGIIRAATRARSVAVPSAISRMGMLARLPIPLQDNIFND
jgi:hypothetical protein